MEDYIKELEQDYIKELEQDYIKELEGYLQSAGLDRTILKNSKGIYNQQVWITMN